MGKVSGTSGSVVGGTAAKTGSSWQRLMSRLSARSLLSAAWPLSLSILASTASRSPSLADLAMASRVSSWSSKLAIKSSTSAANCVSLEGMVNFFNSLSPSSYSAEASEALLRTSSRDVAASRFPTPRPMVRHTPASWSLYMAVVGPELSPPHEANVITRTTDAETTVRLFIPSPFVAPDATSSRPLTVMVSVRAWSTRVPRFGRSQLCSKR